MKKLIILFFVIAISNSLFAQTAAPKKALSVDEWMVATKITAIQDERDAIIPSLKNLPQGIEEVEIGKGRGVLTMSPVTKNKYGAYSYESDVLEIRVRTLPKNEVIFVQADIITKPDNWLKFNGGYGSGSYQGGDDNDGIQAFVYDKPMTKIWVYQMYNIRTKTIRCIVYL